ncbi:MAG: hydantoinase/oxoprolinase family protein [Chromatiales bacterium]|jgi:N-methylhydantoinase A|nr:hydantoinase/oxoprolinase family protein [Chromatiales bacterium]
MSRIAFDIGGTFTDFVHYDDARGLSHILKVPTTLGDPTIGVLTGLHQLLQDVGITPDAVDGLFHATTVATNAVLERSGARTGLITTKGFRDVVLLGRQKRYETYDLYLEMPKPLVERRHVFEVDERVAFDGSIVADLDESSVDRAIDSIVDEGCETLAVCLLHSYANPRHEQLIRARVEQRAPSLQVSLSSDISPKFREFERTSTTVANAYLKAVVTHYLERLEHALNDEGFSERLLIMQSSGGLLTPQLAREAPVRIIESGPAAGVLMAGIAGQAEGFDHVITFDMGGTTAKLGAVDGGSPAITSTFEIDHVRYKKGSGLPINVPAVELLEIGAGGGSIARVNMGMIEVGPRSAGAQPGPMCYGNGGDAPTVTDANVVLGYISPNSFNAGAMTLDAELARSGIESQIAAPLNLSVEQAAFGLHLIATGNMENALRIMSVERGRDPRKYALVAFGGAGPLHAARLAASVAIPTVIVPAGAGVGSALGLLEAAPRVDTTMTRLLDVDATSTSAIRDTYDMLYARATDDVKRLGDAGNIIWSRYAQMRYRGQGFEVHVDLPAGPIDDDYAAQVMKAFNTAYKRRHRFLDDQAHIEAVDWTLVATLPKPTSQVNADAAISAAPTPAGSTTRPAFFPESNGFVDTPVIDRRTLQINESLEGPAIIEDPDCTTVVRPGDRIRMSKRGHLLMSITKAARNGA